MKKCPKCNQVFDDSWKICLNCRVALKDHSEEDTEIRSTAARILVDVIDKTMMESCGVGAVLAGEHKNIEKTLEQWDILNEELQNEYTQNHPDAMHLYWILQTIFTHLKYIDSLMCVEALHDGKHSKGCKVILNILSLAHGLISDPNKCGEVLSMSRNTKIRNMSNAIVEHIHEFNSSMYRIENSLNNIIKFESEAECKK